MTRGRSPGPAFVEITDDLSSSALENPDLALALIARIGSAPVIILAHSLSSSPS